MGKESHIQSIISEFVCNKDEDIESFLKSKAILFEKLGKSRTFLVYSDYEDKFRILAYFTIAIQVLQIPSNLSNRKIKDFDGFSAKINGEVITEIPAILIGQIGKNDTYRNEITGQQLMQYCMNMVLNGQAYLGGRVVMLECKDIPFLIELYESFGFIKVEKDYREGELLQFIRILKEDELIEKASL